MHKLTIILSIAVVSLTTDKAFAVCTDYGPEFTSVPAPVFEICYKSECDITKLEHECGNMFKYSARYDIGWSVNCKLEEGKAPNCSIYWQGRAISQSKHKYITCRDLTHKGTCNILNSPN